MREELDRQSSDGSIPPVAVAHTATHPQLSEVLQDLYISGGGPARNLKLLQHTGITHIVNMAVEIENAFPDLFSYLHIPARDALNERLGSHLRTVADFVSEARESSPSSKVLIHCQEGISRSATAVLACLMLNECLRLGEAMEFLKSKRKIVEPNAAFMQELRMLEQEIFGSATQRKLSFFDPGVDPTSGLVLMDWRTSLRNILGRASMGLGQVMDVQSGECRMLWRAMRDDADLKDLGNEDGVLQQMITIAFEMFGGSDERDYRARDAFAGVLEEGFITRLQVSNEQLCDALSKIFKSEDFADLQLDVPRAKEWADQLLVKFP
jgi:Dual specificity phosphatase, catalytic domain